MNHDIQICPLFYIIPHVPPPGFRDNLIDIGPNHDVGLNLKDFDLHLKEFSSILKYFRQNLIDLVKIS